MPRFTPSPATRAFARELRSNQTAAETLFWNAVRAHRLADLKFKRQVPVFAYIVDFLCAAAALIVELDGPPHDSTERRTHDAVRDDWLRQRGFKVMRFGNERIIGNLDLVLGEVAATARTRLIPPSPGSLRSPPSPTRGEG